MGASAGQMSEMMAQMQAMAPQAYAQAMQMQMLQAMQIQMLQAQLGGAGLEGGNAAGMMYPGMSGMMGGGMLPGQMGGGMLNAMAMAKMQQQMGGGLGMPGGLNNMQRGRGMMPGAGAGAGGVYGPPRGREQDMMGMMGGEDPFRKKSAAGIDLSKIATLDQVVGQVNALSHDQLGCRFLQKQLEERPKTAVPTIFNEVIDNIVELMMDPFGNYLCQKLLDFCSNEQVQSC
ncbi:armadillo-type protein [Baffinella frigidus]|nr:armadillo-type protein [Cryptophyta sp. CCMP2293]